MTTEPYVTDHAVLRYIERVMGFNIQDIRMQMLTPERRRMIKAGASKIRCDGYEMRIKNGAVITIIINE